MAVSVLRGGTGRGFVALRLWHLAVLSEVGDRLRRQGAEEIVARLPAAVHGAVRSGLREFVFLPLASSGGGSAKPRDASFGSFAIRPQSNRAGGKLRKAGAIRWRLRKLLWWAAASRDCPRSSRSPRWARASTCSPLCRSSARTQCARRAELTRRKI